MVRPSTPSLGPQGLWLRVQGLVRVTQSPEGPGLGAGAGAGPSFPGRCGIWALSPSQGTGGATEGSAEGASVLGGTRLPWAHEPPSSPVQVGGWGPGWKATQRASEEAVRQELTALQRAWERGGGLAQPHGPHRLVRSEAGTLGGPGLRATEVIKALRSREACLEAALRQLQGQCRQELARLVGALPGFIWILPPGC